MRHLAIPPSSTDVSVAKAAARHTNPAIQNIGRLQPRWRLWHAAEAAMMIRSGFRLIETYDDAK
jgi:hypothetical protein